MDENNNKRKKKPLTLKELLSATLKPSKKPKSKPKSESVKKYIYENLYKLNAIYVTTNFDDCLHKVANKSCRPDLKTEAPQYARRLSAPTITYDPKQFNDFPLEPGNVLYLHGGIGDQSFNPKKIIIATKHYLEHYQEKPVEDLLDNLFNCDRTILFVGYGLEEYELLEYLIKRVPVKRIKKEVKEVQDTPTRFMLCPAFNPEGNIHAIHKKHYYTDFKITPIFFSIDKRGHDQLAYVIEDWAKQIKPKMAIEAPKDFIKGLKLIDEVL